MRVKNIHNGSRPAPNGYNSWLEYWMKKKNVSVTPNCANKECKEKASHGGHVKKIGSSDNLWYIVPLCTSCNETKNLEFEVDGTKLVPVAE